MLTTYDKEGGNKKCYLKDIFFLYSGIYPVLPKN